MPNYIALQHPGHQTSGWRRPENYAFASKDAAAPVLATELPRVLPFMPLAFLRQGDASVYELAAVFSLTPGMNLFVAADGRWIGGYVPAFYRAWPFRLIAVEGSNQQALCADTESGLFHEKAEPGDLPVFTPEGALTETVAKILSFLTQCEEDRVRTQHAVNLIAEMDLIIPWNIRIQGKDAGEAGASRAVEGLYQISEAALQALAPEKLEKLAKTGALAFAYAQLFSQHQIDTLVKLYDLRAKTQRPAKLPEINLEDIFGKAEDTLRF